MAKRKQEHMHALVLSISTLALMLTFALFVNTNAKAQPGFNFGAQLNSSECETKGELVVNVTEKIVKTVDSGEGGNYWAYDDTNRQIKVWKNSNNTYCALVQNEGEFDAVEGQRSPGNTGILSGDEDGKFRGGYRAKITGVMLAQPLWKTKGSVGTHYYNCDLTRNCPGYINWVDQYFGPGYQFSYQWWGWTYKSGKNVWVNSSDGNSGDII